MVQLHALATSPERSPSPSRSPTHRAVIGLRPLLPMSPSAARWLSGLLSPPGQMSEVVSKELRDSFRRILTQYRRVAITGGPKCGKTTLSRFANEQIADRRVFFHDDFKGFEWSAVPHAMIGATKDKSAFLIEGVNVARALRKGMEVDAVVYLQKPHIPRLKGQISMAKGVHTVFKEWREKNRHVPVFVV